LISFERFIYEKENFVFDYLIYLELDIFYNRSNVRQFWSVVGRTISRVEDKLKTIGFGCEQIEQTRVTQSSLE